MEAEEGHNDDGGQERRRRGGRGKPDRERGKKRKRGGRQRRRAGLGWFSDKMGWVGGGGDGGGDGCWSAMVAGWVAYRSCWPWRLDQLKKMMDMFRSRVNLVLDLGFFKFLLISALDLWMMKWLWALYKSFYASLYM
ncbi:hypothetical protein Dimus_032729 [Dionaea muscipula]